MSWPALEIDFIVPRRRRRLAGFAVLAAALIVATIEIGRYRETQVALRKQEAIEALVGAARSEPPARRERLEAQLRQAHAVMRQLELPWAQLIESLESAALPGVALLQIQPDAERRLLRLTAETRAHPLMLEYLRRLEDSRGFSAVHLLSHQVQLDDPRQPLHFALQASFRSTP